MKMQIRPAMQSDLSAILRIYAPYVLDTAISFEYEVPSLDAFALRFEKITEQFPWLVCETNEEIAGYAYASPAFVRAAYQWNADISVYIAPQYQRHGIAGAFYHGIEQCLCLQGYRNLYAVVTASNQGSVYFHEALEFHEVGRFHRAGYKLNAWHDVIWYEKFIRQCDTTPCVPVSFTSLDEKAVATLLREVATKVK